MAQAEREGIATYSNQGFIQDFYLGGGGGGGGRDFYLILQVGALNSQRGDFFNSYPG